LTSKLEEFTRESPEFAKAREGIETLADSARTEWRRHRFGRVDYGCYRVLTDPEYELKMWEEKGGYIPRESMWGRFPCTANKYLPWMMEQEMVPPWLKKPEVMFEVEKGWGIECVKYAQAAVGSFPIKKRNGICEPATDVYVSSKDLVLAECYTHEDVKIEDIKRIYISPKARPEVKGETEAFAKRYGIPVTYGFPDPEIDEEQEEWYRRHYPPEVAEEKIRRWREIRRKSLKEPLLNLIKYLKERDLKCWDIYKPPRDVVAAALAEAYDAVMHQEAPIGASDALFQMIEHGRRKPSLHPVFTFGHPPEGCLTACGEKISGLDDMRRELERKMERLRREGK